MTIQYPPAIFLMGPTASGKTALSVKLAQQFNAEIISVDSALVYKGMDIGTAKPTLEERAGIAHHLIDILDPAESFSTGAFRSRALELMSDITARGKVPLLVGGTMLYFNSLYYGLAKLPTADSELRKQLDVEAKLIGKAAMHAKLQVIDPVAAARIHPNDPQRVQRALEVFALSGKSMTQLHEEAKTEEIPYQKIKLIIAPRDRGVLHEKIAQRFKLMLQQGFVEEVEALYRRGDLTVQMPSMRAVGYRQVWSYLDGEINVEEMQELGIIATRQLAKRQFTWLRRETDAFTFYTEEGHVFERVLEAVQQRISE
ncbi:tRNA dimethylallyltransferase [Bathymodiolus platifrons methanotrophic gill symbiont]|uniref:tRNA (adenosine(37)-N6)-dimethylallyltransferase MiaA n=1 Tax=Bathymodiolus platifrons methanotrophic gill symbiont TaxID=113268 RepID=UPI000B40F6E7|nr:tRNA (adenosine(37)-N6)-dimethylallyltransferase MiaA [Bathymodiolus platifrons methanotrophic gill symbiont]MCK5869166.1 tRNA (adenosine(37)-N6)-dimethylallyltransferase MiaA [Methyloprofundus sp.]TXK97692.1 tRNA (adenosine(37)-N6)-dimethylallyltransferase MiaA [Methylococcaceae bacterium CS4]TXK99946.1 tRNA (adenosine(37)-N6)-dimethylallyltransferase MiaA [Methylococcaceae bacterium CS5]TXL03065.1 tRNA (adenosine(37)-N6)-dimethylallyltransferase MiaA [Methylococcaceae bacterium CS3]TXL069